jgi:hypothetical protein
MMVHTLLVKCVGCRDIKDITTALSTFLLASSSEITLYVFQTFCESVTFVQTNWKYFSISVFSVIR